LNKTKDELKNAQANLVTANAQLEQANQTIIWQKKEIDKGDQRDELNQTIRRQ
jgi:hypothetical protein